MPEADPSVHGLTAEGPADPPSAVAAWRSPRLNRPVKLAVLISGGGTTLDNLAEQIAAGRFHAEIVRVIVSRPGVGGIDVAKRHGLERGVIERKTFADPAAFSESVFAAVRGSGADLVCLAGFLCLLKIPEDFQNAVLNIHPSLLPSFGGPGMYGRRVHEAVVGSGVKLSGCTVHVADDRYDTGPIVVQRACPVEPTDTAETLAARVFAEECRAFPEAITAWAAGRVRVADGRALVEAAAT